MKNRTHKVRHVCVPPYNHEVDDVVKNEPAYDSPSVGDRAVILSKKPLKDGSLGERDRFSAKFFPSFLLLNNYFHCEKFVPVFLSSCPRSCCNFLKRLKSVLSEEQPEKRPRGVIDPRSNARGQLSLDDRCHCVSRKKKRRQLRRREREKREQTKKKKEGETSMRAKTARIRQNMRNEIRRGPSWCAMTPHRRNASDTRGGPRDCIRHQGSEQDR